MGQKRILPEVEVDGLGNTDALLASAVAIGVVHTLIGPDHYLPFVALGKARRWSIRKTLAITALCGLGHVGASALIGVLGATAGWSLGSLEAFESSRGEIAAWLLIAFGAGYFLWALRNYKRKHKHKHVHVHADGTVHDHEHGHHGDHVHVHESPSVRQITAWSLFVIFVFGPCEALIPLLLFPALEHNVSLALWVIFAFALATIGTMLGAVWLLVRGSSWIRFPALGRYAHFFVAAIFLACGTAIHLGL